MVLSNGNEPAVGVPDVQQVRSSAARIAQTIDEHTLSIHNQIAVSSTEDQSDRQVVLIGRHPSTEHARATAIDPGQDAIRRG